MQIGSCWVALWLIIDNLNKYIKHIRTNCCRNIFRAFACKYEKLNLKQHTHALHCCDALNAVLDKTPFSRRYVLIGHCGDML